MENICFHRTTLEGLENNLLDLLLYVYENLLKILDG